MRRRYLLLAALACLLINTACAVEEEEERVVIIDTRKEEARLSGPARPTGPATAQDEDAAASPAGTGAGELAGAEAGLYLMRAANCFTCHGVQSLSILARHDLAGFAGIVREGVRENGGRVPEEMPCAWFRDISDQDILDMYRYLHETWSGTPALAADLPAQYAALRQKSRPRFQPDPDQSPAWNRGAYLAGALGHCSDCHSPKNPGAAPFSGAVTNGWEAYNITPDPLGGIGAWSTDALFSYLHRGSAATGTAVGWMGAVVENSLSHLSETDIRSIMTYLEGLTPVRGQASASRASWGRALPVEAVKRSSILRLDQAAGSVQSGQERYLTACAPCHGMDGLGNDAAAPGGYPSLVRNSTVGSANAHNMIRVILGGVNRKNAQGTDSFMPAFGPRFSDAEVAQLLAFLVAQFGNPAAKVGAADVEALRQ